MIMLTPTCADSTPLIIVMAILAVVILFFAALYFGKRAEDKKHEDFKRFIKESREGQAKIAALMEQAFQETSK